MGSPSYMAPERVLDEPIGPAADLLNIINEFSKLSLGIENASTENHAKLVQVTTDRKDHYRVEQFDVQPAARDQEWVLAPGRTGSATGR